MTGISEPEDVTRALQGVPVRRPANDGRSVVTVDANRLINILLTATGTVAFCTEPGRVTYFFAPSSVTRLWITGQDKVEATREAHLALRQRGVQTLEAGDVEGWALQLLVDLVTDSVLAQWLDALPIHEL